jgi:hypothetical protein
MTNSQHPIWDNFEDIRDEISGQYADADFMNGHCMLFHLELKRRYPEATPIFNVEHVMTVLGGGVWDHSGCVWFTQEIEPTLYDRYLKRELEYIDGHSTSNSSGC